MLVVVAAVGLGLAAALATAAPPALTFTLSPAVIARGDSAILAWVGTDADTCTASLGWSGPRDLSGTESVLPDETASYRLACTGVEGTATKTLTLMVQGDECETFATCTIDSPTRSCLYPLTVPPQGVLRVSVKETAATLDAQWRLVDALGAPAPACGTLSRVLSADCGPLPAGAYTLEVSSAPAPLPATGAADVHVQQLTDCEATHVDCDQVVSGELVTPIDSDLFRFSVVDAEMLRFTVKPVISTTGTLRPEWRLLTAAGVPAPPCDTFRRTVSADCGPLAAGDYEIQVRDELRTGAGTFALHLQRLSAAAACDGTPIFCDRTQRADIDSGLDSDLFRLSVIDAEVVHVTIDPLSGALEPEWRLLAADGTPAPDCGSFSTRRADDCGPLAAGDYQVQVRDNTTANTGDYEVTVQFLTRPCPNCGNGVVTADEQCDPPGGCCGADCHFLSLGTTCRAVAGFCDLGETCSGSSAVCPSDKVVERGTLLCRAAVDLCDAPESCDGRSAFCPADRMRSVGSICRAEAGECDQAEVCDGISPSCPAADLKRTTVCRTPAGPCDAAERCDGVHDDCPPDLLARPGTVCRPAAHACDVAETCVGNVITCPPNLLLPGACGNGCVDAGETCGEPGLAECPVGSTCEACACMSCATATLRCPAAGADGSVQAEVVIDVGTLALGGYAFDLWWDPSLLAFEGIGGGTAAEFGAAPICTIDAVGGTGHCAGTQSVRTDGPSGAVSVVRVRYTAVGSGARPTVFLSFLAPSDPAGAPFRTCAPQATCTVPECETAAECDDGDACTVDACVEEHCTRALPPDAAGVRCQLENVSAKGFCGREPIGGPVGRAIDQRVKKGLRALDRAGTPGVTPTKRARFLRQVDHQLAAIGARMGSLVRQHRFPAECGEYVTGLVTSSRALVAGLGS